MILDATLFHCEFEMLELRLHVLKDVVDRFVVIESNRTFTGIEKGYLLKSWLPDCGFPVEYVPLWQPPLSPVERIQGPDAWGREGGTRDALGAAVKGMVEDDSDLILSSDLDEIPNPDAVRSLHGTAGPERLAMRHFYFYLNAEYVGQPWAGTVAMSGAIAKRFSFQTLRAQAYPELVPDGGWHFGYCSGEDGIRRKLESFAHVDFGTPDKQAEVLTHRHELRDVHGNELTVVPVDDTFPAYIREHRDEYAHLIR